MNVVVLLMGAVLGAGEPAGEQRPTAEQTRFFETSIRPMLVKKCFKCHGEKKQWGGLRLDSRGALLRGGESGAAIVPGRPDKSLLISVIRETDDELRMPKDDSLTPRQINELVRWVEMGAPFPTEAGRAERTRDPNHWAFQPPVRPPVPAVVNSAWPQSTLDRFILAKLEAAELSPAAQAGGR
jgi:hypothetical protein